jgi:hypothetical protein
MRLRKSCILRRQGSITKHFDLWAGIRTPIVYAYDIESPLARGRKPPQVLPRHLRNLAPFVPVHRRLRGLYIARGPSLNFNETKNISVPANQVDLPAATRRPEIALHHHISQLSQVEVCVFFPVRTGALVPGPRISREHPPRNPIRAVNDRSRENGGKHDERLSFTVAGGVQPAM